MVTLERQRTPEHDQDRITPDEERQRAAAMRLSQSQELLTVAKQRLALGRLALEEGVARGAIDLAPHLPTKPR